MLRLSADGVFDPASAPRGHLERLARAGELPHYGRLEAHVRATEEAVRETFTRIIGKIGEESAG
jgi:glutamate-ammonia-ligase adenylyltransferase